MPTLNGQIDPDGAMVDVEVGLGHDAAQVLRAQMLAVPPPIQKRALLDTGAQRTTIDGQLANDLRALGVQVLTVSPSNAPGLPGTPPAPPALGWTSIAPVLSVRLSILNPRGGNLVIRDLLVDELGLVYYDLIIGRDVLARCDLLFSGRTGRFRLSY